MERSQFPEFTVCVCNFTHIHIHIYIGIFMLYAVRDAYFLSANMFQSDSRLHRVRLHYHDPAVRPCPQGILVLLCWWHRAGVLLTTPHSLTHTHTYTHTHIHARCTSAVTVVHSIWVDILIVLFFLSIHFKMCINRLHLTRIIYNCASSSHINNIKFVIGHWASKKLAISFGLWPRRRFTSALILEGKSADFSWVVLNV